MLSAAQPVNLACCETEDGFPGLLGGFPSRESFKGPCAATATYVTKPKLRARRLRACSPDLETRDSPEDVTEQQGRKIFQRSRNVFIRLWMRKLVGWLTTQINTQLMGRFSRQGANK